MPQAYIAQCIDLKKDSVLLAEFDAAVEVEYTTEDGSLDDYAITGFRFEQPKYLPDKPFIESTIVGPAHPMYHILMASVDLDRLTESLVDHIASERANS